jgi:hypothetical protein
MRGKLNRRYLTRWAAKLGVQSELVNVFANVASGR